MDFKPFPFLGNPHLQTLLAAILPHGSAPPLSNQKLLSLPDGDQLSLEITTPKEWTPKDLTVLLIHGLCGSHQSKYVVRMAKRLEALGIRAVRMNLRGCGSGKKLAKQIYHSGRSEDVLSVLKSLKEEHPDSPIILIGYSLGGNIVLKLAGELHSQGKMYLNKVIAVSPPTDLYACVQLFNKPENALYERKFSQALRTHALELCPDLPLPKNMKVVEFDDAFTAPMGGFTNGLDYYTQCSSAQFVPRIEIPCKILFAEDDPLVCHSSLDHLKLPSNVQIFKTKKGGHLGFLGNPLQKEGFRFLDSLLLDWIR